MKWKYLGDSNWKTDDGRFVIEPVGYKWKRNRNDKYDYYRLTEVATGRHEFGSSILSMKAKATRISEESSHAAIQESERERSVCGALLLEQFVHERPDRG